MSRRHALETSVFLATALAALATGCSGSSTPPKGNSGSSTSAGTNAGSGSAASSSTSGSSGASSGSSSSTSGSTGSSSTSGSSGSSSSTSGSGSSSGSTGTAPPSVTGTLTWNTSALTHPAWVAVFDQAPATGVAPSQIIETDAQGGFTFDVADGGSYYVLGAYAPGATVQADGGAPYPVGGDGGLAPGYAAQGLLGYFPGTIAGTNTLNADLSEMNAAAISITINTSFLPADAGFDGGAFPLLGAMVLAGTDPTTGSPVEDINLATATLPDSTAFSLGLNTTNHDYEHAIDISNVAGWLAAQDGTYTFSAQGSTVLGLTGGTTLTRQIDVHPLTTVPAITGPAPGTYNVATGGIHVQVSWLDAQGIDPGNDEVKVTDLSTGSNTQICDVKGASSPTSTGLGQTGCSSGYTVGHSYKIEVFDSRLASQAEGYALEAAYAAVYIQYQ